MGKIPEFWDLVPRKEYDDLVDIIKSVANEPYALTHLPGDLIERIKRVACQHKRTRVDPDRQHAPALVCLDCGQAVSSSPVG
jgi:hypothetical protein